MILTDRSNIIKKCKRSILSLIDIKSAFSKFDFVGSQMFASTEKKNSSLQFANLMQARYSTNVISANLTPGYVDSKKSEINASTGLTRFQIYSYKFHKNDAQCIGIPNSNFEGITHCTHLTYPYGKYKYHINFNALIK
jgi:hypothetical protein